MSSVAVVDPLSLSWAGTSSASDHSQLMMLGMTDESTLGSLNDEVHVWLREVPPSLPEEQVSEWLELLDPQELERHSRFHFARDRCLYAAAHELVRRVLSRYEPVPPESWRFVVNKYGRPSIATADAAGLRFNLSHTEGLVAVVVSRGRDVGVDVEVQLRLSRPMDIADRFFSSREVENLRSQIPTAQPYRFLDFWTLKEAYIKARGLGLAIPLDSFSFVLEDQTPPRVIFEASGHGDPDHWQFHLQRRSGAARLAVAVERGAGPDLPIRVRNIGG